MKKTILIFLSFCFITLSQAQVYKTVNVVTPGTLNTLLTGNELTSITNLTLTGNINDYDFVTMRDAMWVLAVLDISAVSIKEYNGTNGTSPYQEVTNYPANELPSSAFINHEDSKLSLKAITLPNSITSIGEDAFYYCTGLTSMVIPNSVTSIKSQAILGCRGLKVLTIGNGVKTIGNYAFDYCSGLTSLVIPSSVVLIGDGVFDSCSALKTIRCLSATPPAAGMSFGDVPLTVVYVPAGAVSAYNSVLGWQSFNIVEYTLKVSTQSVNTITLTAAGFNGNLDFVAATSVISYGFCWDTTNSPTITTNKTDNGAKTTLGSFSNTITGLSQNTTYYVRAFATDGDGTVYGNEVSFKTQSLPSAAEIITGAGTVCQGQNTVTYTVPAIAYATSYVWSLPTGVTGSSTTNSITVSYARSFTTGSITVNGRNQWGDGATSTIAITANLLPAVSGTISGNTSVCQGESSVAYSVPAINDATSYTWTLPTGVTGTSTTNNITVNYTKTALSGNITVKGHNSCGDGDSYSLPVTVNKLPLISTTDKSVVCGSSVLLNPTISYSGSGNLKFEWTPTTGLNDATIANPTAIVTNDITYNVIITSSNGCTASGNVSVRIKPMDKPQLGIVSINSSNKNIVVWNKPVTIGIDSYSIYRETNITDTYEKIGTVPYSDLSVFVDDSSAPDVKSNKYKLSIVDKTGLESPLSDPHKTMHLSINKGQNTTWNLIWEPYTGFNPSTYNIYRGSSATSLSFIDATSGSSTQYSDISAPSGDVYYQLEVISPTLVTPSKVPSSLQKVTDSESDVMVSYNSSRSNIASNVTNGTNDPNTESNKIHIYPNPVKDQLKIDYAGGSTFEILNLTGQVVYTGNLKNNTMVQTSYLSSGVYLIKFKTGNIFVYRKIIKE